LETGFLKSFFSHHDQANSGTNNGVRIFPMGAPGRAFFDIKATRDVPAQERGATWTSASMHHAGGLSSTRTHRCFNLQWLDLKSAVACFES
jgi:hypothetical protein